MKKTLSLLIGLTVASCTTTQMALYTGDFDSMSRQMNGTGTMMQRADGKLGFRFIIQSDTFEGIVKRDPETLRKEALERWLGNEKSCLKGYIIDSKTEHTDYKTVVYEGHCK